MNLLPFVCAICCFLEGVLVVSVHAVVDALILGSFSVNALAWDPIVIFLFLLAASQGGRAAGEFPQTGLVLPLSLLAPGQLSLTAGTASADGRCGSKIFSGPHTLPGAGAGVDAGRSIRSATVFVSGFVLSMVVAVAIATLIKIEGNTVSADSWRPHITKEWVIPLFVVPSPLPCWLFLPPGTAACAVGSAAPFSFIETECCIAAGAILWEKLMCRYASVPTFPVVLPVPILPLASIHATDVVREKE